MVFHWNLSYSKFSQVSWTLLSILADLNNDVVWMISTRLLISSSSCPFTNPLVTVPSAPITVGITIVFFFHFSSKVEVLISLFAFFQFYLMVNRNGIFPFLLFFFFFFFWLFWLSFGLVVWPILDGLPSSSDFQIHCNQSSSALFYVVFDSLYRCIKTIFNAHKSSFYSFLDTNCIFMSSLGCKA